MIRPRSHLSTISRSGQAWNTRKNALRLDMNELVPSIDMVSFEKIVARMRPWMFSAYPEVNFLYDMLAGSLGMEVDNIILTAGSDAGIRQTIETFCDPGDKILITHPTYGMYEVYAQLLDLKCLSVTHSYDLSVDVQLILKKLDEDIKVVAIANPNGVLGSKIQIDDLENIICKASERGTTVLLDEAYVEFHDDGWASRVNDFDNLVLARTFSKAAGLAGLRIGYLISCKSTRNWIYRLKPVVETNALAILAVTYFIENNHLVRSFVSGVLSGRQYLIAELTQLGFEVLPGYANFILVDFSTLRENIILKLRENGVAVRNYETPEHWGRFTRITAGPIKIMSYVVEIVQKAVSCGEML